MPKLRVTGRMAALVGVSAAAATATLVAVAGPAMAAPTELTSCTDQVRVRSQPSPTAPVIGSCAPGEQVTAGETRNGFVHLVNKQGWASAEYVDLKNRDTDADEDDEDSDSVTSTRPSVSSSRSSDSLRPSSAARSGSNSSSPSSASKKKDNDSDGGLLGF